MKKIIYILFVLSLLKYNGLLAQVNLVPNPSFEYMTSCALPTGGIGLGYVPPWDTPSQGSPDPFNTCAIPFSNAGVPNSFWGFQQSHSGNGFAGATFFQHDGFREYLQVELDSTLRVGKRYCVSFYVNLCDYAHMGSNNIGMYLSPNHLSVSSTNYISASPQINDTNIISDTVNWTLISGDFIANGNERYAIIGNFFPGSQTDTLNINTPIHGFTYYFVDDVDVHYCDPSAVDELNNDEGVEVYPNPATNQLTIQLKNNKQKNMLEIKDMLGQTVYTETMLTPNITIDISTYPSGVYFISIRDEKKIINRKFIKE